jgi:hypothetical protein
VGPANCPRVWATFGRPARLRRRSRFHLVLEGSGSRHGPLRQRAIRARQQAPGAAPPHQGRPGAAISSPHGRKKTLRVCPGGTVAGRGATSCGTRSPGQPLQRPWPSRVSSRRHHNNAGRPANPNWRRRTRLSPFQATGPETSSPPAGSGRHSAPQPRQTSTPRVENFGSSGASHRGHGSPSLRKRKC